MALLAGEDKQVSLLGTPLAALFERLSITNVANPLEGRNEHLVMRDDDDGGLRMTDAELEDVCRSRRLFISECLIIHASQGAELTFRKENEPANKTRPFCFEASVTGRR